MNLGRMLGTAVDVSSEFGRARGLNLDAKLKAHAWALAVAGIIEDFVPGEITVVAEEAILQGTSLVVEIHGFTFDGEVLSCHSLQNRHKVHVSIKDTDAIGLRRTPRFPVNLPARLFACSLEAPLEATIIDISGDGLGLQTTAKMPDDAILAIESQANIALGMVKYTHELSPSVYRVGVKLHHVIPKESGGRLDAGSRGSRD